MSACDLLHDRVDAFTSHRDVIPFLPMMGLRRIAALLHECIDELDDIHSRSAKWMLLNPFKLLSDDLTQHVLSFAQRRFDARLSTHRTVCKQFNKLQIRNDRQDWHAKLNYAAEQLTNSSMWYGRLRNLDKVYTVYLLHSKRTALADYHHRAPTYPKLVADSHVLNSQEQVSYCPNPDAVVLYDQTRIPLNDRRADILPDKWANNKCLIGLQKVCSWIYPLVSGGYMKNVELYSINLSVNQPLHFHGNIILRNCTITMAYPMFVAAGCVFEMVQCTIYRAALCSESNLALIINHHAQCIVLRNNVWHDMNHIFQIFPHSTWDQDNTAHFSLQRCGDQCDSPFQRLECTNNIIYGLRGKQAFIGCPQEYCHCINRSFERKVEANKFVDYVGWK